MSDTEIENRQITVKRDNAPSLKFVGRRIASVESSAESRSEDYSGSTGRWDELRLYKTARGKFVCQHVERTQWQNQQDHYLAVACDTPAEVIEFFGHGWLAKALYHRANIEDVITID